ncbi:MAG: TolB family protein [Gemmatimonadota bacterium]
MSVTTTGTDVDPNGYLVTVSGTSVSQLLPVNGTVTISNLAPGEYGVELTDASVNCPIVDRPSRQVAVRSTETTSVGFSVVCEPAATIAFASDRAGEFDIYTVKANGTALTRLTVHPASDSWPLWSPSRRLAFRSWRGGEPDHWVMDADGDNKRRLTFGQLVNGFAEWSPDGRTLAFYSDGGKMAVSLVQADGGGLRVLEPLTDTPWPFRLAWSPDGAWLALTKRVNSEPVISGLKIYRIRVDGSERQRITDSAVDDFAPDWSPDGSTIAFTKGTSVVTMDPDGSNQVALAEGIMPRWSPDGEWLAFTSNRTGRSEIYVIRRDGTDERQLSDGGGSEPAWSPVGDVLAYHGEGDIFAVRADGTNRSRLTIHPAVDKRPSFRP